jgi:hypothetical protein
MIRKLTLAALSVAALSACTTTSSNTVAVGASDTQISAFKCPTGIRVENEDRSTVEYKGATSDPTVCAVRTGRASTPMLYGIQTVNVKSLREVRSGLADLFPLSVGKKSYFMTFDETYPGRYWTERYEMLRQEPISVGADSFDAFVLQWINISGGGSEHIYTYWIDTKTGVVLKKEGQWRSGVPLKEASVTAEKVISATGSRVTATN